MNIQEAKEIAIRLSNMSKEYYNGSPMVTDAEYDELYHILMKFERVTGIILPNSPTTRVGTETNTGDRVRHMKKMYSMIDLFEWDEVSKWLNNIKKLLNVDTVEYLTEPKFDGASLNLLYKDGELVGGTTRGDGEVGENVPSVRDIIGIPQSIPIGGIVEIRGEVIIYKSKLKSINKDRRKKGLDVYSNTRNLVSGSLRLKDGREVEYRELRFVPWGVGEWHGEEQTLSEVMDTLYNMGFVKLYGNVVSKGFDIIENFYTGAIDNRSRLDFDIDGIVIKVNNIESCESIGYTSKVPKWMCAYKLPHIEKTTKVESIHTQVGRSGTLCPVATITPTELNGALITKVTLHNFEYLENKDIRIGDSVIVIRSGDVIPKIIKVFKDRRDGSEVVYGIPDNCPICDSAIDKDNILCINLECSARVGGLISHYCGRECMDIQGMGNATIELLMEKGISSVLDLYSIDTELLMSIDGFKDKKVNNLLEAIESSKGKRLYRFIYGLGIPNVGRTVGKIVENIDKDIWDVTYNDLIKRPGIGKEIAKSFVNFIANNIDYVKELYNIVQPTIPVVEDIPDNKYKDKKIVLTGSMDIGRNKVKELLNGLGAKVVGSVSASTNLLIYGDKAGSKLAKAKELGIEIVPYEEFIVDYDEHFGK